ncbi:MAG: SUMF1/EgtB/PvdO family nonheme iron enzyme [Tepidisphaeraceae bacterium]|jgi:hypothetical protein
MNRKTILALLAVPFIAALLVGRGVASSAITIQTVPVGNVGNAADTTGHGSVNYAYNIGEYDVTSSQYTAFLNAVAQTDPYGVYNAYMAGTTLGNPGIIQSGSPGSYTYSVAAGRGNYPVTDVTFWDATRFANWLDNGQPTGPEGAGTTETGTYTLASSGIANNTVTRNLGGSWAVTSEDEWYKAAYYDPTLNAGAGGYWLYPNQGNTISTVQANFNNAAGDTTPVGSYAYPSYYGTYDQGGDVWQWNEAIGFGSDRVARGGSFLDSGGNALQSNSFGASNPTALYVDTGFRVSQGPGLDPNAVPVATATSTQTASVAGNYSTPGTGQTFTYAAYEILPGAVASLALGDTLDLTTGPLFIAAGGTFNASGTVNGNIINAGLVHITAPSFSTFTNQGTVIFQPPTGGATYSFQSFTNDAGGTFYGGGEAASPIVINIAAGQVFQNQGQAVVGDLTVNGSYTQTSTGETLFDLGGPDPIYGYSQLTVNGVVDLSGTIQTDYINGFYPTVGETFDLLIASGGITLNPDFAGMPQEPGFSYALVDNGTVFEATFTGVVPEPASLSVLSLCGLGLLCRRPSRGRERITDQPV